MVKYADPSGQKKWNYMVRVGAVSVVSEQQAKQVQESLAHEGGANLKRFEWSEGGDKVYLRYDKPVEPSSLANSLKAIGVNTNQVQAFGRADENTYEVTLVGLDTEIRRALDAKLGDGAVAAIPSVESVGAKAGKQLQFDGARSLLYAILLIMVYIAFRFDLRYGPGTVVALLARRGDHRRRVRRDLQRVLADHRGGRPHRHRLLDERHHRRLRPHPRERHPAARPALRPDRQPVDQRDALAHLADERHGAVRDPGDELASVSASSATLPLP